MQKIIITIVCAVCLMPRFAVAGEISDWLKAAAVVFLTHETGHYTAGNGGNPRAVQPISSWTEFSDPSGSLLLSFHSPANSMPWGHTTSGAASYGYTMSGEFGLGYLLDHRSAPKQQEYGGALQEKNGKYVWEIPQAQYNNYIKDFKKWSDGVKKAEASVAGAGFTAQQSSIENSTLPLPILKKALYLSGALQAGYPLFHYLFPGNTADIMRMAMAAPEELIVGALIASATSDFLRAEMDVPTKYRIGFLSDPRTGAVGLTFSGVF